MVGNTSNQRAGSQTALAVAGLVVSLACVAYLALVLWAFGIICIDGFMSWEPTPALNILGCSLFAIDLIVTALALRAHAIAARYLAGRGMAPTAVTSASGALPALLGASFLAFLLIEECNGPAAAFMPLLPIAVIAAWGYVALR